MTKEERWLKKADYRDCQVLVEEILNDFKSRTCENCKFRDDYRKCPMASPEAMADTNYCYNFERKDKYETRPT